MSVAEAPTVTSTPYAGFWRRLFAFCLDGLVLGLIGAGLGMAFFDYLAGLGSWGRVIGLCVAMSYFGFMDSRLHNGQTFGKQVMKIKVVGRNGAALNPIPALVRSGVFCLPYFLNGAPITVSLMPTWLLPVLSLLIFGVGISIAYLLIFNLPTRKSLHDLAVGSCVVNASLDSGPLVTGGLGRGHALVIFALLVIAGVAPLFTGQVADREPFKSLVRVQREITAKPGVRFASVMAGQNVVVTAGTGTKSSTNLTISAFVDSRNMDAAVLADSIAATALDSDSEANQKDVIAISIIYGFDIGIASSWRSQSFSYSPAQWRGRLEPGHETLPRRL